VAATFQGDFYVACATVIPVLMLAFVVQGGTYESMLEAAAKAARAPDGSRDRFAALLLPRAAGAALTAAVVGEVGALVGLYRGADTSAQRLITLLATLLLMIVVIAAPTWKFLQVRRSITGQLTTGQQSAPVPRSEEPNAE
jgi:preprotein translocase subunit SecG